MQQSSLPVRASKAGPSCLLSAAEDAACEAFQNLQAAGVRDEYLATRLALESVFEVILQAAASNRHLSRTRRILKSSAEAFDGALSAEHISTNQGERLRAAVTETASPYVVDEVSLAFESLYGRTVTDFEEERLRSTNRRKDNGVFFTPREVAEFLTQRTLLPLVRNAERPIELLDVRILDPAAGTGVFLLSALRLIRAWLLEADRSFSLQTAGIEASRCLYGVDRDSFAAQVARACLWLEVASNALQLEEIEERILVGDSLSGPPPSSHTFQRSLENGERIGGEEGVVWSESFADIFAPTEGVPGFDVILSNPPWGAIKPTLREFFGHLDRRVSEYQGKALRKFLEAEGLLAENGSATQIWDEYAEVTKKYARSLRNDGNYQYQRIIVDGRSTSGDADLYKYFLERCHQLLKPGGRAGFVLPSGFHRAEGASGIRHLFLNSGEFEFFLEFENRRRIFPIHGMYRFALTVFQGGPSLGVRNVAYQLESVEQAISLLESDSRRVEFSKAFLHHVSGPLLAFPEVRSLSEKRLLKKLHSSHPPLGSQSSNEWNVSFVRELDMTNDSHLFVDSRRFGRTRASRRADGSITMDGRVFLPVIEGRMVHQFTCSAKGYRGGEARTAKWVWLDPVLNSLQPHYFVDVEDVQHLVESAIPRVGYCDITGHANERSVLAALIPPKAICGNKVPTCRFDHSDQRLHLIWLAIANSFVIDWLVRRRISTTLNFFHWKQIPFPRIDPDSNVGQELSDLAARLSFLPTTGLTAFDSRLRRLLAAQPDVSERAVMRGRIDAIVARLFDLTTEEFELILCDFPLLDRYQARAGGRLQDSKGSVTKVAALSALEALQGHESPNLAPGSGGGDEASLAGVAYIPSEQAREMLVTPPVPRLVEPVLTSEGA